tara:strand:+ start:168 stop:617 length:450 start_codon:yes stop_codon:yes gene_type:complete
MQFIGIDPGINGGIALIERGRVLAWRMPPTEKDVKKLLDDIQYDTDDKTFCLIEEVHSMPGNSARSMFTFGQNYGMLRAMLIASYIPFETVTPTVWQKEFGLTNRKISKTKKKNKHKAKAQELFPTIDPMTHALADALLIAEYAKRKYK